MPTLLTPENYALLRDYQANHPDEDATRIAARLRRQILGPALDQLDAEYEELWQQTLSPPVAPGQPAAITEAHYALSEIDAVVRDSLRWYVGPVPEAVAAWVRFQRDNLAAWLLLQRAQLPEPAYPGSASTRKGPGPAFQYCDKAAEDLHD